MRRLWLAVALALVLPACGGDGGTYVKVNFEQGTAPATVARIHLDVTLGSGQAMAPLDLDGPITFPASKVLDIRHGEGAFEVTGIAYDAGNLELARGTAMGSVTRGETLTLTLRFGSTTMPDGGVPDGGTEDACVSCGPDASTEFTITPTSYDYGQVFAGLLSPDRTFTVSNAGSAPTEALLVRLTGTGFTKGTDGCDGVALAAGATCDIKVAFTPQAAGSATATLRVVDIGATTRTLIANLNGTAVTPPALSLTPSMQTFADAVAGADSVDVTFTVLNTGGAPSGGLTVASSDATQFVLGTDNCTGRALAGAESCTVNVHFHPLSTGTKNAMLTVTAAPGGMATSALTGNGLTGAVLALGPATHAFGSILAGTQSGTFNFTVSNTGGAASGALGAAALGATTDFAITADGCMGMVLMPGGNCTVTVRFQPASVGSKMTTLTVMATPGGSDSATLSGIGQSAAALSAPTTQDFGAVTVNATASADIVVTNMGDTVTSALSVTPPTGEYSIVTNGCTGTLAPGASCTIELRFSPTGTGPRPAGSLQISATAGGTRTVALSGTGLAVGLLQISPPSSDLGATLQGSTGSTTTFTVTNTGGSPSGTITTARAGTNAADFALTADNCNGMVLAAAGACTVGVRFQPASAGSKTASVSASATPGGTASASLSATGLAPAALTLSPTSFSFASTVTGGSSTAQDFVLRNTGGVTTSTITVSLGGTNMSEFAITANTCGATLAAGATCTISVQSRPASAGAKSGALNASAGAGVTASAMLSGSGLTPATLSLSPTSHSYGNVVVGQSGTRTFTITNSGDVATTVAVGGSAGGPFTVGTSTCSAPLAAGGSCTIVVNFTPASAGLSNGMFTATAGAATAMASLSGTGIPPAQLTITPTPRDYGSVILSSSTDLTFTVGNSGGATSGAVSFSLGGADASQFAVVAGGTCVSGSSTLSPAATCTVVLRFAPSTAGSKAATLTASATPGATAVATVSGLGVAPAQLSGQTSKDFGSQEVNTVSAPYSWILTNTGGTASGPISTSVTGPFNITSTCSAGLAPAATCNINVRFMPITAGPNAGVVTASATPGGTITLDATGTGAVPASSDLRVTAGPPAPAFPLQNQLLTQVFTVTNLGPALSTGTTLTINLPSALSYTGVSFSQGLCSRSGPTVTCDLGDLAVNANATVGVTANGLVLGRASTTANVTGAVSDPVTANNLVMSMVGIGNGVGTATNSFAARVDYPTGNGGRGIAMGDINNDANPDLVVANSGMNEISVLPGHPSGNGAFQSSTAYGTSSTPFGVVMGRFNGDANFDVAIAHNGAGNVGVRFGMNNGMVGGVTNYSASGTEAYAITAGALGAGSALDLVVANSGSNNISLFKSNGDGTFQTGTSYAAGSWPRGVAVGDVTGDGWNDVVVASYNSNSVLVFTGNGNSTLQTPPMSITVTTNPRAVEVADLDGDGKPDIVVALYTSNNLQVYWGNGDGTFSIGPAPLTGMRPRALEVVDLNADGFLDILPVCELETFMRPVMGQPGRAFLNGVDLSVPSGGSGIVAGYLNTDTKVDFAMSATNGNNSASVFLAN